ncbi:MAG TPA: hypothetical protein VN228_04425 [Pyrinomonadaceae bacterium]|nr:hypothetical protein [Pyrinomonadaceae bacterium]
MIHHISIAAKEPSRVAEVLAELWGGYSFPFPPVPGSYIAMPGDTLGTAIEVTPLGGELVPGADGEEVQSRRNETPSPYTATHAAVSVPTSEARIKEVAAREGWRAETFERGGVFRLVELWVENRLLLELLTPAMQRDYLDFMTPEKYAGLFGFDYAPRGGEVGDFDPAGAGVPLMRRRGCEAFW